MYIWEHPTVQCSMKHDNGMWMACSMAVSMDGLTMDMYTMAMVWIVIPRSVQVTVCDCDATISSRIRCTCWT